MTNLIKHWCVVVASFMVLAQPAETVADPNVLLGEAIKASSSISATMPTKDRLDTYQIVFDALEAIVDDYPSSDQAIKILTNQSLGSFNPAELRHEFVDELTEYYDVICETSPSYECLGFVSLKIGVEGCSAATSSFALVKAHQNLKNAVYIFNSQGSNPSYIKLATSEYRSCVRRSRFEATEYATDLFSADLVDVMLALAKPRQARGLIERMESPVFKLRGTIALGVYEQKPFDRAYYSRLDQYVSERVPAGDKAAARWELSSAAIAHSIFPITKTDVLALPRGSLGGADCALGGRRDKLLSALALQRQIIELPRARRGYQKSDTPELLDHISEVASSCSGSGLSLQIHGQLALLSLEEAAKFSELVLTADLQSSAQVSYVIKVLSGYEDLFKAEWGIGSHNASHLVDFERFLNRRDAQLQVFKVLVDYGEVCEATAILFNKLKGSSDYDDGVEYIVGASSVDMYQKHSCGDSDLELLLN